MHSADWDRAGVGDSGCTVAPRPNDDGMDMGDELGSTGYWHGDSRRTTYFLHRASPI